MTKWAQYTGYSWTNTSVRDVQNLNHAPKNIYPATSFRFEKMNLCFSINEQKNSRWKIQILLHFEKPLHRHVVSKFHFLHPVFVLGYNRQKIVYMLKCVSHMLKWMKMRSIQCDSKWVCEQANLYLTLHWNSIQYALDLVRSQKI